MKAYKLTGGDVEAILAHAELLRVKADDHGFAQLQAQRDLENATVTDDAETYLHAVGDVSPGAALVAFTIAAGFDRLIDALVNQSIDRIPRGDTGTW